MRHMCSLCRASGWSCSTCFAKLRDRRRNVLHRPSKLNVWVRGKSPTLLVSVSISKATLPWTLPSPHKFPMICSPSGGGRANPDLGGGSQDPTGEIRGVPNCCAAACRAHRNHSGAGYLKAIWTYNWLA